MNNNIGMLLAKYDIKTNEDKKNAMKEIIQEIVLAGLSCAGFFDKAAFYGGTALRIFYGLDRFSEDLDFSLMEPDIDFDLKSYFPVLEKELSSYGLKLDISEKEKTKESGIRSAFLKGNTREHILMFYSEDAANSITKNETMKIKFEVDVNPPHGATFESKYQLLPSPYEVRLYDLPSLFAGKLHAVICRSWQDRVKGRDLYDYLFYLSKGASINMEHLKARLVESNVLKEDANFDKEILLNLLENRFDAINFESAKEDVERFIKDKRSLDLWSKEFFKQVTHTYLK